MYNNVKNKSKKKFKPSNRSPKSIRGEYQLSIHGNFIKLKNLETKTEVEARCHPEDNFDIACGIQEAFRKLNEQQQREEENQQKEIKVGDWVKIINIDKSYTTYTKWIYQYLKYNDVILYEYDIIPRNNILGTVIAKGEHDIFGRMLLAIKTKDDKVYLVEDTGVEKVFNKK